jgi:hypothetical protein
MDRALAIPDHHHSGHAAHSSHLEFFHDPRVLA